MHLSEIEIITRYFEGQTEPNAKTRLGIGDDAALLEIPGGEQLVTSVDTLNGGVHFRESVSPFDLGYKSLAVSVSDIAAMGADPFSALLSMSLLDANEAWLQSFASGFFDLAKQFNIELIGGDTCRGALSITTVVNGTVPAGKAILRSGATPGDLIYVTGSLGDAGLALQLQNQAEKNIDEKLLQRLNRPQPRVSVGRHLQDIANSAIDISDGLVADLEKLCKSSHVGARIYAERLPLSSMIKAKCALHDAWKYALISGDDYELVFTIPAERERQLLQLTMHVPVTKIGEILAKPSVIVLDENGDVMELTKKGYDGFYE